MKKKTTINTAPAATSSVKELPIIRSARFKSPSPRAMEQSGAPPVENRLVKAVKMVITGKVSPKPVSAKVEALGRCPM